METIPLEKITAKIKGEVQVEKLPNDHPLLKSIFDKYEEDWKRHASRDKKSRTYFYNSDIGRCARATCYQFYSPEEKADMKVGTIMMFKFGDLFHDEIQNMLTRLGHTTGKDIEFGTWAKMGFERRGRIDLLLTEAEAIVIVEIKSKNPYAFETPPDEAEIDQALSYVDDCKNDPYFKDTNIADYCYVLYVERGGLASPPLAIWKVTYSEERIKAIKYRFKKLWTVIKDKNLVERPYARDSTECQYCRFKTFCWRDVPAPPEPKIEVDKSIEPPSQEIVDSMAAAYVRLKEEIKAKEKELELATKVLLQYAMGTGSPALPTGEKTINFMAYNQAKLDLAFIETHLADKWQLIAKPQVGLLKQAVENLLIDGTTYEKCFTYEPGIRITVSGPKKGKETK